MQRPAVQFWPKAHARPHAPQFSRSVAILTSHPFAAIPSQLPQPPTQVKPQVPAVQVVAALTRSGQTFPQLPQLVVELRSTSQPLVVTPSQLAQPARQVKPQVPAVQVGVALTRTGQTFPQPPQWIRLVAKFASQPLAALPSQLP
jgi:hypothetical protein